jgi:hypothetical protein
MKLKFSPQISEKTLNVKFNKNPSSGSCSWRINRRTHIMKLIVAVRNFENAPKNELIHMRTDYVMFRSAMNPNMKFISKK